MEKIDIRKMTPEHHQALVCLYFAMQHKSDERYKKREEYWRILSERFNKKVNTYKHAKDAYDFFFDNNGRKGWDANERSLDRRGKEYSEVYEEYKDFSLNEIEEAVKEIIDLYKNDSKTYVSMKCGFPKTVHEMLQGQDNIVIDGVYTLQEEIKSGTIIFVTLGGDVGKSEVDWEPGFFGIAHVVKEPYEFGYNQKDKYYKFNIHMDCIFGKTYKREDFQKYPKAFDARYIGPELTRDPSQAISTMEESKAVAVIRAVLDSQPGLLSKFEEIFDGDFMDRVKGAVEIYIPTVAEFGETTEDAIDTYIEEQKSMEEPEEETFDTYTKDDFLKEVYLSADSYDLLKGLLLEKKNIILQGAPGVGKTFMAKRLAFSILGVKNNRAVKVVQFHQSYGYEDFVVGYRPTETGFKKEYGTFYEFCKEASKTDEPYFFIIDEINRGNVSSIFGELLMLIEADKRGESINLLYTKEKFTVPPNVHIIGMMNTADRSIAIIDYALRRRFAFFEIRAAFEFPKFVERIKEKNSDKLNRLIAYVKGLNKEICDDESLGKGFEIGHSYFCTEDDITDAWIKTKVEYELIPLINEYWFDEPEKVNRWSDSLRETVN